MKLLIYFSNKKQGINDYDQPIFLVSKYHKKPCTTSNLTKKIIFSHLLNTNYFLLRGIILSGVPIKLKFSRN